MINSIILCLAMLGSPNVKETQIPMPFGLSLSGSWRTEMERQQKQMMGIQGSLEAFNARIGKLESQMDNVALGVANNQNSGSQILSGDTGFAFVSGFFLLLLVAIIGYYRTKITLHKQSGLILASSTSDEQARELAAKATPQVQAVVKEAIDTKNLGNEQKKD